MLKVLCPNPQCRRGYKAPDDALGCNTVCKVCGQEFTIGADGAQPRLPAPQAQKDSLSNADAATGPPPVPPPAPARAVDMPETIGRFEVRRRLGAGAFGAVYLAHDPLLDREVALKVPHLVTLQNRTARVRVMTEAKAAAQLRHPNIVPVYEAGCDGETYYIASAFIEGQTLEEAIAAERPDFPRVAKLVMDLAVALSYAHERKIVHRDIKPANIMLDALGDPLVMDFGLARLEAAESRMTTDGSLLGTPIYMPPEQAAGRHDEVGPASDQYSLGVVLYELLCGETPFSGPPAMVISLVINQEPVSPRQKNREVPKDLETICLKAMSKHREHRYPSCQEMAEDLHRWLTGMPITARRVAPWERAWRWCRRQPVLAAMIATLAASLLLGSVFSTYFAWQAQQRAVDAERSEGRALQLAEQNSTLASQEKAARLEEANQRNTALHLAEVNASLAAQEKAARIEESRQRIQLLRQQALDSVRAGWAVDDDGDRDGAIVWFADAHRALEQAIELASEHPLVAGPLPAIQRELQVNRLQLANALRVFPLVDVLSNARAACFSKKGDLVATGSEDGRVTVRDIGQRKLVRSWMVQDLTGLPGTKLPDAATSRDVVRRVSFAPDDSKLLSITDDGVQLWNLTADDGRLLRHEKAVRFAEFVDNGHRILAADDDQLCWWDVATYTVAQRLPGTGPVLAVSEDCRTLAIRCGTELHVLKAASGEKAAVLDIGEGTVASASFSDKAHRLAILRFPSQPPARANNDAPPRRQLHDLESGVLEIWDIAQARRLTVCDTASLSSESSFSRRWNSVALSPDGSRMAVGSDSGAVVQFYAITGKPLGAVLEHDRVPYRLAYAPDGSTLAVACGNLHCPDDAGSVRLWDVSSADARPLAPTWFHPRPVVDIHFDSSGRHLLAVGDFSESGEARLWCISRLALPRRPLETDGQQLAFSEDEKWLIEYVKGNVWSTDTGKTADDLAVHQTINYTVDKPVYEMHARMATCVNAEGHVQRVEMPYTTKKNVPEQRVRTLRLPTGCRLALRYRGTQFGANPAVTEPMERLPEAYTPLAFDGQYGMVANARTPSEVRVWNEADGAFVTRPLRHDAKVASALLNDDLSLLVVSTEHGEFRVWDLSSSLPVTSMVRGSDPVKPIALSTSGRFVVVQRQTASDAPSAKRLELWEMFPVLTLAGDDLARMSQWISGREIDKSRFLPTKPPRRVRLGGPPPAPIAPPAPKAPLPR